MRSFLPGLLAIVAGVITVVAAGFEAYLAWRRHKPTKVQHSVPGAEVAATRRDEADKSVAVQSTPQTPQPMSAQVDSAAIAEANRVAATAMENYINSFSLAPLTVTYDATTATATVYGVAKDRQTKERIILATGKVFGVKLVDNITIDVSQPEPKFYTAVQGDTILKIAKKFYGSADDYVRIVAANKLTLAQSEEIPTGQVLRIPNK